MFSKVLFCPQGRDGYALYQVPSKGMSRGIDSSRGGHVQGWVPNPLLLTPSDSHHTSVGKRVVRTPLECILVLHCAHCINSFSSVEWNWISAKQFLVEECIQNRQTFVRKTLRKSVHYNCNTLNRISPTSINHLLRICTWFPCKHPEHLLSHV